MSQWVLLGEHFGISATVFVKWCFPVRLPGLTNREWAWKGFGSPLHEHTHTHTHTHTHCVRKGIEVSSGKGKVCSTFGQHCHIYTLWHLRIAKPKTHSQIQEVQKLQSYICTYYKVSGHLPSPSEQTSTHKTWQNWAMRGIFVTSNHRYLYQDR